MNKLMFGKLVDEAAEEDISDFLLTLSIPDALDPEGWFRKLPAIQQQGLRGCSRTWHLNHWMVLKAIAERPAL